jgi:hypothetical protein
VSSSTVSVVNVDTGEGASYRKGGALLVKHATNAWEIRPIHSIATDALTVGFQLANAPGTGVNLGRATTYYPANADHQTLSIWNYLGNGGGIQMMAGARVTQMDITADAGQLLNCSYTMEGVKYFFNPIEVTTTNNKINFNDGGGAEAVAVAAKMYKDPHELADAIAAAMNAATTDTITVTYSDTTGKYTIATDGASLSLLWKTGASGADNTDEHIGDLIGYADAADDTGALTYTADTAMSWAAPYTPTYDTADPLAVKANEVLIGDADDTSCFSVSSCRISISTPKTNKGDICSDSGISGSVISSRQCSITVTSYLQKHEADKFRRFRSNTDTRFAFIFGSKTGGNWDAGKSGCFYAPACTITSFDLTDLDGLVGLEMELQPYDADGAGEIFLSFV